MSGWDDPETAASYEAFCRKYSRYARANAALIANAGLEAGFRVLDLAAGTGRTAEAALDHLGPDGRVVCVEPSPSMRGEGMRRIRDARVTWCDRLPQGERFDRVLCGAAMWQLQPLPETFRTLAGLLSSGGALCFNIPALYLMEPDGPGGGTDPLLLSLAARLMPPTAAQPPAPEVPATAPLRRSTIRTWLEAAGLRVQPWTFNIRLTQEEYGAWLKIPILAGWMHQGIAADEWARRVDDAMRFVDRSSWKWERWRGWTAWKE